MDGPSREPRRVMIQRSFALTRFSEDVLTDVYTRVLKVRPVVEDIPPAADAATVEVGQLVQTGGPYA